jgi:hypothetical protein
MNPTDSYKDCPPSVLGALDFSREQAAYAREQERLVREHLGKIALVFKDEVVGVFDTADEAILEAYYRLGDVPVMLSEVRDPKAPLDYVSSVDINDPSVRLVNSNQNRGQ